MKKKKNTTLEIQQMVLWWLDFHMQRMKLDPYLTSYTKINSQWIRDLNVWAKRIKFLDKKTGISLHTPGLGNGFLDTTPKEQASKEIIDKLDFIKMENFCVSKWHHPEIGMIVYCMEKKVFANHTRDLHLDEIKNSQHNTTIKRQRNWKMTRLF